MNTLLELTPSLNVTDPSIGLICAAALHQRGWIEEAQAPQVAELITEAANEAVLAAQELLRRGMIARHNEAVVAEFIKRTVRRRLWGVGRPIAVGRLAQNLHQRRQMMAAHSLVNASTPIASAGS